MGRFDQGAVLLQCRAAFIFMELPGRHRDMWTNG